MWTQTSPSSNPNSPDLNFGHEQCEVSQVGELNVGITEFVEYKYNYCYFLSFTAAVDQPEPQKTTERPQPESQRRIVSYVGLIAAVLICAGLFVSILHFTKSSDKTRPRLRSHSYSGKSIKREKTPVHMEM